MEYQRQYRAKNKDQLKSYWHEKHKQDRKNPAWREKERKRGRDYWRDLRHNAIMAYGGYVCRCCGETEPKFLNIDHVFNDGAKHRKEMGTKNQISKWLKDHGYPAGFQVLCFNCNLGKMLNKGICPHKALNRENRVNSGEVQNGLSRAKLKGIRPENSPF